VDRWFDQADRPLDVTMRRARDIILGADGRADLEAVIRAWCDWKADGPNPPAPA
jgi:hypothetical protein